MDKIFVRLLDWYIWHFLFNLRHYLFTEKKNLIAMYEITPGFEHNQIKGITIKNMIVTVVCTASIVASVTTAYFGITNSISSIGYKQEEQNKIIDLRIRTLEDQQKLIREEIRDLQMKK